MNHLKRIALLSGGLSKERDVSYISADSVQKALVLMGYDVVRLDPGRDLANRLLELKPDVVFNCLHGTFGEDGSIPGLLEVMGIPYTHSGVAASAIAMNKILTKTIAKSFGVQTADYLALKSSELFDCLEDGKDPMSRPYVVKPNQQGSTFGVYLIINEESKKPLRGEWAFGDDVLVEKYIPGQELSVGVFDGKALGVLELKPKTNFYDYKAKYEEGMTEHIYPAHIPLLVYEKAMKAASLLHNVIGCRTLSRSDFRYNPEIGAAHGLFFLEVNTHPGFTDLSILPEIAAHNGITFEAMLKKLIQDAKCEIMP